MKFSSLLKQNASRLSLMAITGVLITVTGIIFHQNIIRILPLYISLFIGLLQSQANRFSHLLGGLNSLLYMGVYMYLGLYASVVNMLLFSFPMQILTFIRWNHSKYKNSTKFRSMSWGWRIIVAIISVVTTAVVCLILNIVGSDYSLLDSLSSLLGILISILTLFAFIEYSWLMIPSGIINICLNLSITASHPEHITYVIYSSYATICAVIGFIRVRRLHKEQQKQN